MGVTAQVSLTLNFPSSSDIDARLMQGEDLAAERLLAITAARAPLDLGTLIGSGTVEPAQTPEGGSTVVYDTPYAAHLHEHPEYDFQNGRQGKYVETPAMESRDELGAIIAKQVNGG